ncbi:MAG: response regulator transcription factor [Eubacterium sp.]
MIYLVEDDSSIRELIVYTLNSTGLEAQGFEKPSKFWDAMESSIPALVILDVMLPEESGIEILQKLRTNYRTEKLPIIMATAKASEYDKINGLESGADDYIAKPFSMMEMVARVKALLRRVEYTNNETDYTVENLYVCPTKHIVKVNDKEVVLTLKEFEMLCLLLRNRGIVLTRDQLLNKVWGYSFDGESRTVDVHIRTLRQKLGTAGDVIKTIRGVGYKIGNK